jgi:sugar lactone lactonase YvrE
VAVASCAALAQPRVGHGLGADRPVFVRMLGAPGTLGTLTGPLGVAVSPGEDGRIYVADTGNARIQVFGPAGGVIGMWGERGEGNGGFWRPTDLAVSPDGRYVYVIDQRHRQVQQYDAAACLEGGRCWVQSWGGWGLGRGLFQEPMGIAVDRRGRVYVVDWSAHVVQQFDSSGAHVRTIGGYGYDRGQIFRPSDVDIGPDGRVWVADRDNHRISIFDPETGEYVGLFNYNKQLHYPTGIAVAGDRSFVVLDYEPDYGRARARLFDPDQHLIREEILGGNGSRTGFPRQGASLLPDGRAVVTRPNDAEYNLVIVPRQGPVVELATRGHDVGQFDYPCAVALDTQVMAVVDRGNRRVVILDRRNDDAFIAMLGDINAAFDFVTPRGVAIHRTGEALGDAVIYVADAGSNRIFRATPLGEFLAPWGDGAARRDPEGYSHPYDVAVAPDGDVYIADAGNDRIVHRSADGRLLGIIGSSGSEPGQLVEPTSVEVGPDGLIYVIEQTVARLQAFAPDGELVGYWPGSDVRNVEPGQLWRPTALAVDGTYLYVLENESGEGVLDHVRIQVFRPDPSKSLAESLVTGFATQPGVTAGKLWDPRGIAAEPGGWVVVADSGNNRIQFFNWHPEETPLPPTASPSSPPTEPPASATPAPTETVASTDTPAPTDTPTPTDTPGPTATPLPTDTPAPTDKPGPTEVPPTTPLPSSPTATSTVPVTATVAATADPTRATPSGDRQPTPSRRGAIYLPITVRSVTPHARTRDS